MLIRKLCDMDGLAKIFRQQPESLLAVLNCWLTECLKSLDIPPEGMSQDEAAQWLHFGPALKSIERAAILAAPESEPCREFLAMLAARNVQSSRVGGELVGYHFPPCSRDNFNALVNIVRVMNGTPHGKAVEPTGDNNTPPPPPPDPDTPLFSEDYRSGRWKDYRFTFSTKQAAVMEKLHSNWQQGTPDLSKDVLLEAAGSDASELRDLFRGHEAWKTLIISGTGKGLWRLAPKSP